VAECARHLLGVVGVVPEVGSGGLLLELGDVCAQAIDIDHLTDIPEGRAQCLDLVAEVEF
jgi:hypothetical protein